MRLEPATVTGHFMNDIKAGDLSAQWALPDPAAQSVSPSRSAPEARVASTFKAAAGSIELRLGTPCPLAARASPERPALIVHEAEAISVAVAFHDAGAVQPPRAVTDCRNPTLDLAGPRSTPSVPGCGIWP